MIRIYRSEYGVSMARYDVYRAFEHIPEIMGLELVRHGKQWIGGYYMNGERHMWRRDKLKVCKWNNDIWVHEEGGEHQSITTWLQNYGGAADYLRAIDILRGKAQGVKFDMVFRQKEEKKNLHVSIDVLMGAKAYNLQLSPLFRHMCKLFPESRVREVWDAYNVTTNSKGGTVFWYLNQKGQICHDKICWYGEDGHRVKTLPMGRSYRISGGYTESPLFGSHLDGEIKGVLEAEKSCLYAACYYGGVWLATGGKNALRDVEGIPLYPDRDAEELWSHYGDCVDWYSDWSECGDHSDLGDKIEWLALHNAK